MNAALLCPGPSLAQAAVRDIYLSDVLLGVNRSVTTFECDWWVFLDWQILIGNEMYPPTKPIGRPRIFTTQTAHEHAERHGGADRMRYPLIVEDIWKSYPQNGWTIYSATAALILAAHVGAKSIDVYGADWKPDAPDFDGLQTSHNRGEGRWESERAIWDTTCAHLETLGISVRRIFGTG